MAVIDIPTPETPRYPWVEGFDTMLDATMNMVSGQPVDKEKLLGRLGMVRCADDICDGYDHNIEGIRQREKYSTSLQVDSFMLGALKALHVLTASTTTMEVTNV